MDDGTLKDNYYSNPFRDDYFCEGRGWPGGEPKRYTLKDWQAAFPWADKSPKVDPLKLDHPPGDNEPGKSRLVINDSEEVNNILLAGTWRDLDGKTVTGSVELQPYTSRVLILVKAGR